MQPDLNKRIAKIFTEFNKIGKLSKAIIKYGTQFFLALFAVGTLLVIINHTRLNYDLYIEFIARSVIKSSFTIFAEAVIGGLLMDYIFRKT